MRVLGSVLPVLVCLVCTVFAGNSFAAPDPPTTADLSISAGDITFTSYGGTLHQTAPGEIVTINLTVHNNGPGNSASANASIFYDGDFLVALPVPDIISPANSSSLQFFWDTTGLNAGDHVIRVGLTEPGDPDPANNNASADFILVSQPVIEISFDEPIKEVSFPESGGPVSAEFTGLVLVNNSMNESISILLSASSDYSAINECDPAEMTFGPGNGSQTFTLVTTLRGPYYPDNGWTVSLDAEALGEGYSIDASADASVLFKPDYRVALTSDRWIVWVGGGKKAEFTLTILNNGNMNDSYDLSVANQGELDRKGWNVTLSDHHIVLQAHESVDITVSANQTGDWPPPSAVVTVSDYSSIDVRVSSGNGGANTNYTFLAIRQDYSGKGLLFLTIAVAASTIFFSLLRVRWPGKQRLDVRKFDLAMYTLGISCLTFGLFFLLLSQGLLVVSTGDLASDTNISYSVGVGVQDLPVILPFMLAGTIIGLYLLADSRTKGRVWPYLFILVIETVLIMGFVPYPMNYGLRTSTNPGSIFITVSSFFNNPVPEFLLLFSLLYILGMCLWYLVRPDTWPLKAAFAGPPRQGPAAAGPEKANRD